MNPTNFSFEDLYRTDPDPWRFASSDYELGRYRAILHALEGRRYSRAFEPGCSIGVLTVSLAPLCGQLHSIELSPTAARLAAERCAHLPNVTIRCGSLPQEIPPGNFDLIVFSEIGYYFPIEQLRAVVGLLLHQLVPGGTFLAAHWLGQSVDHVSSGDDVHDALHTLPSLIHEEGGRHPGFRLDRWSRI